MKPRDEQHDKGLNRRDFCQAAIAGFALLTSPTEVLRPQAKKKPVMFTIALEYTPRSPQPGQPFTESSFSRQSVPFTFDIREVGVALVDLWNFDCEGGPVGETLGPELSLERGLVCAP